MNTALVTINKDQPHERQVSTKLVQIDSQGVWGRVAVWPKDRVYIEVSPQNLDGSVAGPDGDWAVPEMWADDMSLRYETADEAQTALEQVASGEITITFC